MRNLIPSICIIGLILLTSCSKDEDNTFLKPEELVGSVWKFYSDPEFEYISLNFVSETTVDGWSKYPDEVAQKDWTGSFDLSFNSIVITVDGELFSGTIENDEMVLIVAGEAYTFSRE